MRKKLVVNNHHGFTLVELLVVISIMAIMGSVGFVSLQSSKSSTRLQTAQREVTATIKLAQSYALQGKTQGSAKVCGYGVRFVGDASTYQIFYKIPTSGNTCTTDTDYGTHENVEILKLENGVVLSSPDLARIADTEIYFSIPFGKVSGPPAVSSLTFQYPAGTGATKSITISPSGQVVEN